MEFERALFRIHQRTLHSESVWKARTHLETLLPWVAVALAICLALLHSDYVGQARCLPLALEQAGFWNTTRGATTLPEDSLLQLHIVEGDEFTEIRLRETNPVATNGANSVPRGVNSSKRGEAAVSLSGSENSTAAAPPFDDRAIISYRFAFEREILLMRPSIFENHNFIMYNITIPERCLAPSRILSDAFRILDAFDGIIVNELAYTFRSRGYLERLAGTEKIESWAWSAEQVEAASPREGRHFLASLLRKAMILLKAVITFVFISSITGFFIRVAVNGSAVLMFPIAIAAQALGSNRVMMGILTRSFPWIGVHVEVLRRGDRPLWPLFRSHFVFLFIQSFAYLACNIAWRLIFYRKSSPEGFEERLFSFCSILELFNLIFVRSASSTAVFPKLAFACMVYLHFYLFCSLYPFYTLAFSTCVATCSYVMAYCLNHYEEPALRADPFALTTPTTAHPRASYMPQLSPSWSIELAPLWTMFYPPELPGAYPEEAMRHISDADYFMP